jgi:hypothetical protein
MSSNVNIIQKEVSDIMKAAQDLDIWIRENGLAGWDPYDIKDNIIKYRDGRNHYKRINKLIKIILLELTELFPMTARKLLSVKPKINAKAVGLFLASYTNMYQITKVKKYLIMAQDCVDWLIQNRNKNYSGYSWGYPFDWQSICYFPKNTPSSVVTATVGDGFNLLYKITNDRRLLEVCKGICSFFMENLRVTHSSHEELCYSYTPIDDYQVHNANLFIGEYLVRIGKEINDSSFIKRGICCGKFALKEQQPEGYLPYWGLTQTRSHGSGKMQTDHYHSGFEIRMLYKLWKHTGIEAFQSAYKKYYIWYLKNMFVSGYIPKMTSKAFYPVNIHSCAEALLCQSTLLQDHPERMSDIIRSANWVLNKMEYASGRYAYLIKKYPVIGELRINITMIRWGQAWMLRAYSELFKYIKDNTEIETKFLNRH